MLTAQFNHASLLHIGYKIRTVLRGGIKFASHKDISFIGIGVIKVEEKFLCKISMKVEDVKVEVEDCLWLCVGTKKLLGRNFFDTEGLDKEVKTEEIKSPAILIDRNKPQNLEPGVYCVAVNSKVLGSALGILTTPSNRCSIYIMVIWENQRASHYFAGDANSELERRIVTWTGYNADLNPQQQVPTTKGEHDCYVGGLVASFKHWMIKAMGVYGEYPAKKLKDPPPDKKPFTMVLIILKVERPLFSVGFADISGLNGGFGINSAVTPPTVDNVTSFPFLKSDDSEQYPLDSLKDLMDNVWFSPREGPFWIAAGLKVTAFQMLSIDAVAIIEFNPDIRIGINGVAVCDMPSPKAPFKSAHIELGIVCTLDIQAGVFKAEAQLSPKSFVLHPSCHVVGVFALYSWFKDGQDAVVGDGVMTIGGYHQAFHMPKQYPRPPKARYRLVLGFSVEHNRGGILRNHPASMHGWRSSACGVVTWTAQCLLRCIFGFPYQLPAFPLHIRRQNLDGGSILDEIWRVRFSGCDLEGAI